MEYSYELEDLSMDFTPTYHGFLQQAYLFREFNEWLEVDGWFELKIQLDGEVSIRGYYQLQVSPPLFDFTAPCYQLGPHCAGFPIPGTELIY